jgi:uncharacterized UBP type Zn finger protein
MNYCPHFADYRDIEIARAGCEDCLRTGGGWVHLRACLACGHVGCCDQSPGRHARAHFHATDHPVVRSAESREAWTWCYIDRIMYDPDETDMEGADLS